MAKIFQIGAGLVGRTMAIDLAKNHELHLADFNYSLLQKIQSKCPSIKIKQLDATDKNQLQAFIKQADIVLLAVPGFLGFQALKCILEAEKNVVDISFSAEDSMALSSIAESKGVTAIVDAGVAPGIPNYLLGYHDSLMKIESFEYYVGGLPKQPKPPYNYKAPFSPIDVIEEYTRPARMMVNRILVEKPALSDIEIKAFKDAGNLEAFNTDGLRSILTTMPHIPNMKEKTLRFPGHANLMQSLHKSGKFDPDQIEATSKSLLKEWELSPGESEFTILDVIIKGENKSISYHLYDEYDKKNDMTSMSRSTGFTATATIELILNGYFKDNGIFPPELVGKKDGCTKFILDYLKDRDLSIELS